MYLDKASGYIHKIIDPVVKWACNFGMYALVIMVLAVVADVIMRILALGIPGLNEVQVFMMVAVTFLSIAYVGVKKGHIVIELFVSKLSAPHRAVSRTINDLLGLGIIGIITWRSAAYALQHLGEYTAVLELPKNWSMFLVTVGAGLLSIIILADILEDLSEVVKSYRKSRLASKIFVGLLIVAVPLIVYTIPLWLKWLPWEIAPLTVGILGLLVMLALMFAGLLQYCGVLSQML